MSVAGLQRFWSLSLKPRSATCSVTRELLAGAGRGRDLRHAVQADG